MRYALIQPAAVALLVFGGCASGPPVDAPAWTPGELVDRVWPADRRPDGGVAFDLEAVLRMGFDRQAADPAVRGALDLYLGTREQTADVRLLVDGGQAFAAREALVRSATRTVYVQQLFWPMQLRPARLLAMLAERVEHGVVVRLLVDRLATSPHERAWLVDFDRHVRARYAALADRYPRFAAELKATRRVVRLHSSPEHELANDVIWHDPAAQRLSVRRVRMPAMGKSNLFHYSHAKLIVVDARSAITGGINHADPYAARGRLPHEPGPLRPAEVVALKRAIPAHWDALTRRLGPALERPQLAAILGWRDTDIAVDGPIAGELAASFERSWRLAAQAQPTDAAEWFTAYALPPQRASLPVTPEASEPRTRPVPRTFRGVRTRVVEHIPRLAEAYMLRQLRWLLGSARRSVDCHVPYLSLPRVVERWVAAAARRGVRVRLLTNGPDSNDIHRAVAWEGRSRYRELLRAAGPRLRIYEWVQAPLHSKVCVADGRVAVVGSNNRDLISQFFSAELGMTVHDRAFAGRVARMMRADFVASRPIRFAETEAWARALERPLHVGAFDSWPMQVARLIAWPAVAYLRSQARRRMDWLSL